MNDPRVPAIIKRSRHNNSSLFIICQDYYELPTEKIKAYGNIYHIFKPNIFLDIRNNYQNNASMDLTLDEFNYLTSTCWNEKDQTFTTDITKNNYHVDTD